MCLPPTYIKGGGEVASPKGRAMGGSPTWAPGPSRVRPPFPIPTRRRREGGGGEKERGAAPQTLVQFAIGLGRRAPPPGRLLLSSTKAHEGPLTPRGVPVTLRYSGKCSNLSETFPVSKHNLPIYQSSCLDHFETHRHVRDHIWDSEKPSVHQIT